jgi:hypothetical protein
MGDRRSDIGDHRGSTGSFTEPRWRGGQRFHGRWLRSPCKPVQQSKELVLSTASLLTVRLGRCFSAGRGRARHGNLQESCTSASSFILASAYGSFCRSTKTTGSGLARVALASFRAPRVNKQRFQAVSRRQKGLGRRAWELSGLRTLQLRGNRACSGSKKQSSSCRPKYATHATIPEAGNS